MKKICLLLCTAILLCSVSAFAADIAIDYDMDFDNSVMKLKLTTEAKYNQALSVVVYEGTAMGGDLSKIVKIADADADGNGEAYVELKLPGDLASGEYTISVSGGGSIGNSGSKVISFVNKSELSQIMSDINSATQDNIKETFENGILPSGVKYSEMLELPTNDGVYKQFMAVRKADYKDNFTAVNEINESLKTANLLYDLNNITNETELLDYIKNNAAGLNADVNDADFKAAESKFATAFLRLKNSNALTGKASFEEMWSEALAISAVNSANAQTMTAAIEKYADTIGISKGEYQSACAKFGDVEINKALRDKDFKNCGEIVSAYKNRISDLTKAQATGSGASSGGGGSPSGGGGSPSKRGGSGLYSGVQVVTDPPAESEPDTVIAFTDLSDAEWARESVMRLAADGVVSGYEDNAFKPNKAVTREEFITLVIRAFRFYNSEATCDFSDITESDWCCKYVASAAERNIVSGFEDGSFGKGKNISRQDAATMLFRICKSREIYFNDLKTDFSDAEEFAEYAKEAIGSLGNVGIISGFEDGSFKPMNSLTRAQAVIMIDKILKL